MKNEKFCGDFLEKLLSYPEIYFGPPGTIWALRNRILRKKSRKKWQTQVPPLGKCPRVGPPPPPTGPRNRL